MKSGRAPGPHGYGPGFFKKFQNLLKDPLTKMYLHSVEQGHLPHTLYSANISLVLKKGKLTDAPGSYRPISLIDVDSKIFSKVLATRLKGYLTSLIKDDQSGFIKNRVSQVNMRRLLNTIQYSRDSQNKGLIISLDAEKAYNRIEWFYLFSALESFGLGGDFIKLVKLLYHSLRVSVIVNGMQSSEFVLSRSNRQGDPMSPLIFDLAVEPLAEAIRSHDNISGIKIGHSIYISC